MNTNHRCLVGLTVDAGVFETRHDTVKNSITDAR